MVILICITQSAPNLVMDEDNTSMVQPEAARLADGGGQYFRFKDDRHILKGNEIQVLCKQRLVLLR